MLGPLNVELPVKKEHVVGLLVLSVALSHALSPAIAWAQAKIGSSPLTITSTTGLSGAGTVDSPLVCTAATSALAGCVNTTTQTVAGKKTFAGNIVTSGVSEPAIDFASSSASCIYGSHDNANLCLDGTTGSQLIYGSLSTTSFVADGTDTMSRSAAGFKARNGANNADAPLGGSNLNLSGTGNKGTCTLNGASPAVCTGTVTASTKCICNPVGTTAAIAAKGCAVSLSSTTLTVTSANGDTHDVNYLCF